MNKHLSDMFASSVATAMLFATKNVLESGSAQYGGNVPYLAGRFAMPQNVADAVIRKFISFNVNVLFVYRGPSWLAEDEYKNRQLADRVNFIRDMGVPCLNLGLAGETGTDETIGLDDYGVAVSKYDYDIIIMDPSMINDDAIRIYEYERHRDDEYTKPRAIVHIKVSDA